MAKAKPKFYECGTCGQYHPKGYAGDCRDDSARFFADALDRKYGISGWEEVGAPGDARREYGNMRQEGQTQFPVFMPYASKYDHTVVWPDDLPPPSGITGGERRFVMVEERSGWGRLRKLTGLAVAKHGEQGVTVYGDRPLKDFRESGHDLEGRVNVEGKTLRAFTSSQLFLVRGKLVSIAILYVVKK